MAKSNKIKITNKSKNNDINIGHELNQKRKKVMFVKNWVTQFSKNIADLSGAFSF